MATAGITKRGIGIAVFSAIAVFSYISFKPKPPEPDSCINILPWNKHRLSYDGELQRKFDKLLEEKRPADDPELRELVKELIDPPSSHVIRKRSLPLYQTPQAKHVDEHFNKQRNKFFIEAGALDGERSSNTLWLEVSRNWTGILIEPDPFFYTQIRGKARKAHSINACISGKLDKLRFQETEGVGANKVTHKLAGPRWTRTQTTVPCFPLETILHVLGQKTVDYFSLDVEGHEMAILNTLPWDKLDIKVMTIEYPDLKGDKRSQGITKLKDYMKDRGYKSTAQFDENIPCNLLKNRDLMFVKV